MRQKFRKHLPITALIVSAGTIGMFLIHFFFVFLHENIDGYQYWAFGEYLKTGVYPFVWPMIYSKPTTISPPLYSVLLYVIGQIPRGDILLHMIQLGFLGGASIMIYMALRDVIPKPLAVIIACMSAWIPGSIIFASGLMTENGMQFLLIFYCVLFLTFIKTRSILPLSLSVLLGVIMGLWKYSFLVYGFLSLGIFLSLRPKKIIGYVFPFIGVLILLFWILYNHAITGVWGLSDTKYMYAHMVLVWEGKIMPQPDNPATVRFRNYVPESVSVHNGYWTFLEYILPKVNYDWVKVDEIVGGMGMAAIKDHPFDYIKTVIRIFFETHANGRPYWHNLSRFGNDDPNYPLYCGTLSSIQFCQAIIMTPWTFTVWNTFVKCSDWFYVWIFPLWSIGVFFPMLAICLLSKQIQHRWLGILFLAGRIPIAMTAYTGSRYLVPFYPLMIIITVIGVKETYVWWKKRTGAQSPA